MSVITGPAERAKLCSKSAPPCMNARAGLAECVGACEALTIAPEARSRSARPAARSIARRLRSSPPDATAAAA